MESNLPGLCGGDDLDYLQIALVLQPTKMKLHSQPDLDAMGVS